MRKSPKTLDILQTECANSVFPFHLLETLD